MTYGKDAIGPIERGASLAAMLDAARADLAGTLPSERALLELLRAQGLDAVTADRLQAEYDRRERSKARADLAEERRRQVVAMSLRGHRVREIADRLGLSYNYVVQLRATLAVPRDRARR